MKKLLLLMLFPVKLIAGEFSLIAENDVPYKTDRFFTHGTRFQYQQDDYMFSIGQNMYTPINKKATWLIPDDRPYAGWLYASVGKTYYSTNFEFFIENQLGAVGPNAFAGETQNWMHKHIGSSPVCGWSNQIPNHVGELLIGRATYKLYDTKYIGVDPFAEIGVGNLVDYCSAGLTAYLGYNLPENKCTGRDIPFKLSRGWDPYIYTFFTVEPKLMLYNMLLEDPRFTIHLNHSVFDQVAGVVAGCKYFELKFSLCYRSKEFEEQEDSARYGSASISVKF